MLKTIRILAIAGLVLALVPAAQAETIYFDDFSGSSGNFLNGQAPDTRPGTETWEASETRVTNWKADGSIAAGTTPGPSGASAFLPFEPEADMVYTLSADLNVTDTSPETADWFCLGFTSDNNTAATLINSSTGDGSPWMLLRGDASGVSWITTFSGPATGNSETSTKNNPSVSIVLDTRETDWVATFYSGTDLLRTYTYTGVDISDDINYVGFGRRTPGGNVDNFTLTAEVPEPATMSLLAIGGIALIRRKRRA